MKKSLCFIKHQVQGSDFVPNHRMQILENGLFSIKSVTGQDAGDYTCIAENSLDSDSVSYKLNVLGKIIHV